MVKGDMITEVHSLCRKKIVPCCPLLLKLHPVKGLPGTTSGHVDWRVKV